MSRAFKAKPVLLGKWELRAAKHVRYALGSCFRRSIALSLAATLLLATPAQAQFGNLGSLGGLIDKAQSAKKIGDGLRKISEPEEIKMGGDLAAMLLGAAPLTNDPAMQHYVNRLGRWLALHGERPGLLWKFGVVESRDFNAFSTPGGYVLISRGLFDTMRSEAELAGVLAHEIAHVVRRHQINALQKAMQGEALSEMNGYFRGGAGGIGAQFTTALLNAGKEMFVRGLDKEDEYEADRMGVVIAARSGYSPYGLVGVLQTLSAAPQDKGFSLMFKTHPLPAERIARLDTVMGDRLDGYAGLVDDLPSFVALRTPPPPPPVATPAPQPAPKPKPRPRR